MNNALATTTHSTDDLRRLIGIYAHDEARHLAAGDMRRWGIARRIRNEREAQLAAATHVACER